MTPDLPDADRLRGVNVFVRVMEAGSFAGAAVRLGTTRSAVAKAVTRLEARLGVQLLQRSTRRLVPTEAGAAYHERCQRALAEIEAAEAALDAGHRGLQGRLRVSVPRVLGRVVAPVLYRLAGDHPALEFDLSLSDRPVDVAAEQFDLAVRVGPLPDVTSLQVRTLGEVPVRLFGSPSYLATQGTPTTVADLARHTALVFAFAERAAVWRHRDGSGRWHELHTARTMRFDDLEALNDAARAGLGLARLPWTVARPAVEAGTLTMLPASLYGDARPVSLLWPATRSLSRKQRLAIDALVERLPPQFEPVR